MCWVSGTALHLLLFSLLRAFTGGYGSLLVSAYGIFAFVCGVIGYRASNPGSVSRRHFKGLIIGSLVLFAIVILPWAWEHGVRKLVLGW